MGAMGNKLRMTTPASGYTARGIVHWCPACKEVHQFALDGPNSSGARWTWDGNREAPSFTPSMRITTGPRPMVPVGRPDAGRVDICHYILTGGIINFCGDCTHEMAGQSVPIPDWPYARGSYGGIEED